MTPPLGFLRRPSEHDKIAPQAVLQVAQAIDDICGPSVTCRILDAANLKHLPDEAAAVDELVAVRLHQALRALEPERSASILAQSGRGMADVLMAQQLSGRAKALLSGATWPIAAWLLGRWAGQYAWSFAGSGRFSVRDTLTFELQDNPFTRGEQADAPICHYHAALFERMFQSLVDPRLVCREIACEAAGASACLFVLALE